MNFAFLSPHFPPNYYQFCTALQKYGAKVFGIADTPYNELRSELRNALTEYYKVRDMENYDEMLRAFGYLIHKHGRIDAIDSMNEYWLETEARLRTDFNIPGTSQKDINTIKSKSSMKKTYIKGGLSVAKGKVATDLKDAEKFIKETGYPVVAKPDKGVGASNTYKIENQEQLEKFFKEKPAVDFIFEEFIPGSIYTFDGLADKDGKAVFYTSHVYDSVMDMVNCKKNTFIYSMRTIPEKLIEAGLKTLKAFDTKGKFFHLEFFRTEDGSFIALEVNMRPPGGFMLDMFNYANDINIYDQWANMIVNNRFDATYSRKYHCTFTSRRYDGRSYKYNHDDILAKYGQNIVMNDAIPKIMSGAMGDYVFIARHEDLEKLREINNYILEEN